nr:NF041680 family putative transposase [Moorena sp. SIO1F2]
MDAVLTTRNSSSLADFSLSPFFRRQWSSVYEVLEDSRPSRNKLMRLYINQMPTEERPVLGVDHTLWERLHSPTLQDRTYQHQPNGISYKKPISIGQGYSTIAWIPEAKGSWALPLRHERITSWENPISKATWQIKQVCQHLLNRPIILLDSEYGNASFLNQTTEVEADFLMRIRSNRCLYAAPPLYAGKGRPRKHGQKIKLNQPSTWWEATETIEFEDSRLGRLRVRRWKDLHFSGSASSEMELILVERLEVASSQSKSKPLWLVWVGQSMPTLSEILHKYLRRFAVDHWYRFLKQRLHWTIPQLSTPQQCERWSDLMPIMTWELWLARDLVAQHHLPWALTS